MSTTDPYHQIGKFIVYFQNAEETLKEILILLADSDNETILILINELEYSQRLKTADVMFARFIDLMPKPDQSAKIEFHKLIGDLQTLSERRNVLVHSKYTPWVNVEGRLGLMRQNSKLRASKGIREQDEEKLLPEAFDAAFEQLTNAHQRLEEFRRKVIYWPHTDVQA